LPQVAGLAASAKAEFLRATGDFFVLESWWGKFGWWSLHGL